VVNAVKTRLVHAAVRHLLRQSPHWTGDIPISQEDMLAVPRVRAAPTLVTAAELGLAETAEAAVHGIDTMGGREVNDLYFTDCVRTGAGSDIDTASTVPLRKSPSTRRFCSSLPNFSYEAAVIAAVPSRARPSSGTARRCAAAVGQLEPLLAGPDLAPAEVVDRGHEVVLLISQSQDASPVYSSSITSV
jgi:hypothetical protein